MPGYVRSYISLPCRVTYIKWTSLYGWSTLMLLRNANCELYSDLMDNDQEVCTV